MADGPYSTLKSFLSLFSVKVLEYPIRMILSENLDCKQPMKSEKGFARDYRGLAEQIILENPKIEAFEQIECRTMRILEEWENVSNATLDKLVSYLEAMDRYDVIDKIIPKLKRNVEGYTEFHESQGSASQIFQGKRKQICIQNIGMNEENKKYVEIIEEPLRDGTRFRYENEGRCAGLIKGVNYTDKWKSYPTIKIHGYHGNALVVVSLVTNEQPYYPHPHKLVGNNCTNGVCSREIDNSQMTCSFPNLRIQCVKRKDVKTSLALREKCKVDPFGTGFSHSSDISKISFDAVRLCFQVFLPDKTSGYRFPLSPVISSPIYDKTVSDLTIKNLIPSTASVSGGQKVTVLCGQVNKSDIEVIFGEEICERIIWSAHGKFSPCDVHRKTAIVVITPPYNDLNIQETVNCFVCLRRPSDKFIGKPKEFTLLPLNENMKRQQLEDLSHRNVIQSLDMKAGMIVAAVRNNENYGNDSRLKQMAIALGANYENVDMKAGMIVEAVRKNENYENDSRLKQMAIALGANYENDAGAVNQLHPSEITGIEFGSPDTVNVHENENYFENVPFSNYQNTVSTAGDMGTVISPYTQQKGEDVLSTGTPTIHLNNDENIVDSLSTSDHTSGDFSPYARRLDKDVFLSKSPEIQFSNATTFRGSHADDPPVAMNIINLGSNANNSETMSGIGIDINSEINDFTYIYGFNHGMSADESQPFHDSLRDEAHETLSDYNFDAFYAHDALRDYNFGEFEAYEVLRDYSLEDSDAFETLTDDSLEDINNLNIDSSGSDTEINYNSHLH